MFNVTVLKLRDILKFIIGILAISIILLTITKSFSVNNTITHEKISSKLTTIIENNLIKCIDDTLPTISMIDEEEENINYIEDVLKTQISTINGIEKIEDKLKQNEIKTDDTKEKTTDNKENIELATNTEPTEVVTPNPISLNFNTQYNNVKIKNETDYNLTEDMLKPDIKIENKNIILFHTHSCESYTSSEQYPYTPTGTFRTTDLNFTVTRVGTELETYMKKYNYNVIHDTSYHDYPAYNGSYTRSLKTVEDILSTNKADIIIDLHRDAIGSRSDYAPTVKIGNEYAAQVMFVIGTNNGGLWHPDWNQNLKFAIKVQEKAEELYPGLFKPIMVTKSRYNQHTGKYASIIEVGATGNTLEQCLTSMKYLSKVMNEVIQ